MDAAVTEPARQNDISVLVVEDNLDDARLVSHFLGLSDTHLHGITAINLLNAQYLKEAELILNSEQVDLILLDLHLPDGQGRNLVRRICSNFPKIPVVAMTGKDTTKDLTSELLLEGAQDFIRKDAMDGSNLFRAIQYALNRQKLAIKLQEQKEELSISHAELATINDIACRDMREPIDTLRAFTERLEDSVERARMALGTDNNQHLTKELAEQMPSAIEMIKASLNDMTRLSNGIRSLSRLDNRAMYFSEVDCQAIVESIVEKNKAYIDANQVKVTLEPLESVIADETSMQDIFQGIIDNALQYLDPTRPGEITISCHRDLTYTTFLVKDNGRGMNEDEAARVFEVVQRGDVHLDNDVVNLTGDGMSMAFVRTLVRRHRGIVWFETQPGHGTVFYFTIDNGLTRGQRGAQANQSRDEFFR